MRKEKKNNQDDNVVDGQIPNTHTKMNISFNNGFGIQLTTRPYYIDFAVWRPFCSITIFPRTILSRHKIKPHIHNIFIYYWAHHKTASHFSAKRERITRAYIGRLCVCRISISSTIQISDTVHHPIIKH